MPASGGGEPVTLPNDKLELAGRLYAPVGKGPFPAIEGNVRFRPEVRNISSPSGRGAHVGRDPVAQEKSWNRATEFIERHR